MRQASEHMAELEPPQPPAIYLNLASASQDPHSGVTTWEVTDQRIQHHINAYVPLGDLAALQKEIATLRVAVLDHIAAAKLYEIGVDLARRHLERCGEPYAAAHLAETLDIIKRGGAATRLRDYETTRQRDYEPTPPTQPKGSPPHE